jgi:hypothetical protein
MTLVLIGNSVVVILGLFTIESLMLALTYHYAALAHRQRGAGNLDEAVVLFRKAVRLHRNTWPLNRLSKERRGFALLCSQARMPTP